jgi:hypothetical protein
MLPDSTNAADEELPPPRDAPNLLASEEELGVIRQQFGVPAAAIPPRADGSPEHLTMPSFRSTPISEFNHTQPLLS